MKWFTKKANPPVNDVKTNFVEKKTLLESTVCVPFSKFISLEVKGNSITCVYHKRPCSSDLHDDFQRIKELVNIIGNDLYEDLRRYIFATIPNETKEVFAINVPNLSALGNISLSEKAIDLKIDASLEVRPEILQLVDNKLKDCAIKEFDEYVNLINKNIPKSSKSNYHIALLNWMVGKQGDDDKTVIKQMCHFYSPSLFHPNTPEIERKRMEDMVNALSKQLADAKKQHPALYISMGLEDRSWTMVAFPQKPVFPADLKGIYDYSEPLPEKKYPASIHISKESTNEGQPTSGEETKQQLESTGLTAEQIEKLIQKANNQK